MVTTGIADPSHSIRAEIDQLSTMIKALNAEDRLEYRRLNEAMCVAGDFVSKMERSLVEFVWPGAAAHTSPVKHLAGMARFFDYLGDDGHLLPGVALSRLYDTAPAPYKLLKDDPKSSAFVDIFGRWRSLLAKCPSLVTAVISTKDVRGGIAHVYPPQGSTAESIRKNLQIALAAAVEACPDLDQDRAQEVLAALETLVPLQWKMPAKIEAAQSHRVLISDT